MRRINITVDTDRITKSFANKSDLVSYIKKHDDFRDIHPFIHLNMADTIWDLNVGKSVNYFNYTFSIQSKQRIGSQLHDGSIIGKNN